MDEVRTKTYYALPQLGRESLIKVAFDIIAKHADKDTKAIRGYESTLRKNKVYCDIWHEGSIYDVSS